MLQLKRAYVVPEPSDGTRVLVDRLWPRGLSKVQAQIDLWLKDIAPSTALRTWYGRNLLRFDEFRQRYLQELQSATACVALDKLRDLIKQGTVTLIVAAHDSSHIEEAILLELLQAPTKKAAPDALKPD